MTLTPHELDTLADAIAERLQARMAGQDEILDVRQAAKLLGVSIPTLERRIRAGDVPSFTVGRLRRLRRAELLALDKEKGGQDG